MAWLLEPLKLLWENVGTTRNKITSLSIVSEDHTCPEAIMPSSLWPPYSTHDGPCKRIQFCMDTIISAHYNSTCMQTSFGISRTSLRATVLEVPDVHSSVVEEED